MKLVVNEPTLCSPTEKQMSATRAVGVAQQRRGPLEAPGQQVGVRRLAERAPELAAEVRARQAGRAGQVVDAERLEVAGVGEVLGAQQVAGGRDERHRARLGAHAEGAGTTSQSVFDHSTATFPGDLSVASISAKHSSRLLAGVT